MKSNDIIKFETDNPFKKKKDNFLSSFSPPACNVLSHIINAMKQFKAKATKPEVKETLNILKEVAKRKMKTTERNKNKTMSVFRIPLMNLLCVLFSEERESLANNGLQQIIKSITPLKIRDPASTGKQFSEDTR